MLPRAARGRTGAGPSRSGFLSTFRKRPITSDRYKMLQHEAARKTSGEKILKAGGPKSLPSRKLSGIP